MSLFTSSKIIDLPQVEQQSEAHCGPAVLQLLLAKLGKKFTQNEIVAAAKVGKIIAKKGTRPKQLALAVKTLVPGHQLWFKQLSTIEDLDRLINEFKTPVAINWQGLFYDSLEEETPSNRHDRGHYSVVVGINPAKDRIIIQDPYPPFAKKNRVFSLTWFITRWEDVVRDKNMKSGRFTTLKTKQFLFIIAPESAKAVNALNLLPPNKLGILRVGKRIK